MCGIVGAISKEPKRLEYIEEASRAQSHRGPDMDGIIRGKCGNYFYCLAHQRLSIFDLTENGRQPFKSLSGTSSIIYNGEVFNFKELRTRFHKDLPLQSESDTPVVIETMEKIGVENALREFNGMWAFAWLDEKRLQLILARDRLGIKPLYYCITQDTLYFASELKGLLKLVSEPFQINDRAVANYLFQSLQDTNSQSFFQNISTLSPGHFLRFDLSAEALEVEDVEYWHPISNMHSCPVYGSYQDNVAQFGQLFNDAVHLRLEADVPVGVLLSGGIDSSAIAAHSLQTLGEMTTLSAVSKEGEDESEFIDAFDRHFGHTSQRVVLDTRTQDLSNLLERAIYFNDGPVGSFSNVLHMLLMQRAAERNIKVILSGQGADEVLCGYKKYVPFAIYYALRDKKFGYAASLVSSFLGRREYRAQFSFAEAKRYMDSKAVNFDLRVGSGLAHSEPEPIGASNYGSLRERQCADLLKFSVPFLTHYEDRMSMSQSIEIRLPFLDYRLVEFGTNLEPEMKVGKGWTKRILRDSQAERLPDKITWRRDKKGFVNPQETWLRTNLQNVVRDVLNPRADVFERGYLDYKNYYKIYEEFVRGNSRIWYRDVFNPLAFQIWINLNKSSILQ